MSRKSRALIGVVMLLAGSGAVGIEASGSTENGPLAFLEPFVGVWVPHPDWPPLQAEPRLHSLVPLNLQWRAGRGSLVVEEGLPLDGSYTTSGTVVWNAVTERAELLAHQREDDLVFDGYYEPVGEQTIRRVYEVIDRDAGVRTFRETLRLRADGVLEWTTEQRVGGEYRHVRGGSGPEFHAVRPSASPPVDPLADYAWLVGVWLPQAPGPEVERVEPLPGPAVEEAGSVRFSWGEGRQWIEVDMDQTRGGEGRVRSAGLMAWDPRSRRVVVRQHGDRGTTIEGTMEHIDSSTLQRSYRAATPDGRVTAWRDTWRFAAGETDCFVWSTEALAGRERSRAPIRYCRRAGMTSAKPP